VTIPNGQTSCYQATQTISVAGNGTAFNVQNGGSATMIAGQNILFNPGTVVQYGGYLWGHIAPGGPWCITPLNPSMTDPSMSSFVINETESSSVSVSGQPSFKVYPNPTNGTFTLLFSGEIPESSVIRVEIYGMQGERLMNSHYNGERKHEFSLDGKPAGVYFIRVLGAEVSGSVKVIKQ
jgi:hypothetical protein